MASRPDARHGRLLRAHAGFAPPFRRRIKNPPAVATTAATMPAMPARCFFERCFLAMLIPLASEQSGISVPDGSERKLRDLGNRTYVVGATRFEMLVQRSRSASFAPVSTNLGGVTIGSTVVILDSRRWCGRRRAARAAEFLRRGSKRVVGDLRERPARGDAAYT